MKLGWHSRGYLPHFEAGEHPQFLTWRQADSLPKSVLEDWNRELNELPDSERRRELVRRAGRYLDEGRGTCLLRQHHLACLVRDVLLESHGKQFRLYSWVVMPNHVHVVLTPLSGFELGTIIQKLKGSSSRAINLARGASGSFWHRDYFDKLVRDEEMFERIRLYIEWSPVRAGLCHEPKRWPFSSASESFQEWLKLDAHEWGDED